MSANQFLIDRSTRHQVLVQRFAAGESTRAYKQLSGIRREILGRLADEPSTFQHARLKPMLIEVDSIIAEGWTDTSDMIKGDLAKFAKAEAEFTTKMVDGAITTSFVMPTDAQLATAIEITAFNVGSEKLTVDQALNQFGAKKRKEIVQDITDGVILGDTTATITRNLREKMTTLYKRQIDALVRTSVNHVASVAREETYKANTELLDGYEWVATLDNRTTTICGSLDGKVFDVGRGNPMPPAHWNCRSTTIPKIKKQYDLGSEVTGKRPSKGSEGMKLVNARETYSGWLKRQSKEFQNEALGIQRAKMFRSGEIGMKGFVDPTGREYTLNELKLTHGLSLS